MSVSILMPAYNAENFIDKAITGILNQTYTDFELLIINDGSTDRTGEIIKSYSDSRIRIIQQENMGVSRSLNRGIALANGGYIRRHDADDFSEPDMLERQMTFLKAHPEIPMVSTQCAFMTERGKVSFKHRQPKNAIFKNDEPFILAGLDDFIPYSPIVHGTVLARKSIFEEFKGYRTEFLTSEDNDLWLRILDKYPIAVLNCVPYYLRLSGASATQTHKSSTRHFRELALTFAKERRLKGSDPLMRGEKMPSIRYEQATLDKSMEENGKHLRSDILNFKYKVDVGARDYKAVASDIVQVLESGWRLKKAYKDLLFPLLGEDIVKTGVSLKKKFL